MQRSEINFGFNEDRRIEKRKKSMKLEREFFYDEVRDGFYIPGIMKRAWNAELMILSEVDRICKKYDIPYYADGGTLLGAVRDGQFIPWDDDLDIIMIRKDFHRFMEVSKKELPEELILYSTEVNPDCKALAASVEKVNIGFQDELLRKYHGYPYSAVIDIFFLDERAKMPEEEERWKKSLEVIAKAIAIANLNKKNKLLENQIKKVEELFNVNLDRKKGLQPQLYFLMDKVFQEFNGQGGEELAIMSFYAWKGKLNYPRYAFDKPKFIPFYGMQLPIPKDYDTVLRTEYGDYHKKVKGFGEHVYPCFKRNERQLKEISKGIWDPSYHFAKEDLERPQIQNFREIAMITAESLMTTQKQILKDYQKGEIQTCLARLSTIQEEAIFFGNAIEQKRGEGTESVSILEGYCDDVYHAYQSLDTLSNKKEETEKVVEKNLEEAENSLKKLKLALEKDFKRQVVFLPHSAKHFESLRPLVDALLKAGDTECKIIPIPYYDKCGDGSLQEMHYEGEDFPKEYKITDYRNYDFAVELPDCIVINSPYDQFNQVWTVDPFFYSKEMKRYTNKLVYIPWFVTDEINPKDQEDEKAFINMEYYVEAPGIFHSDLSIVQSEEMKKAYLAKIEEFAGRDIRKKLEEKIVGAGSCLLNNKEGKGTKGIVECFKEFLLQSSFRKE